MKKSCAVIAAVCSLALGACSTASQPAATTQSGAPASASASASAKPAQKKYPDLPATRELKVEPTEGGTAYTTVDGAVTLTAPADFRALTKGTNPLSEVWLQAGETQVLLSKLGKPLGETTKADYLDLLSKGESFKEYLVSEGADVTISGAVAWMFDVTSKTDAKPAAKIYVFEHRGIAYEVTVKAADQAGFGAGEKIATSAKLNGKAA
ncbi:outer membrane lipoprotein-sorting protein [Arcanobacterium wilhelmae]|uniref:Outer membrane lipoprotein-sorting protein n=1 Tax=Arcanobacterium wilhelmae TaxID=1803177 RepID=A0ABT9NAE0_9ACTO|nr:hypothetical protein [Arcanobacterium wilhelmae]MDP9800371.1 outer membrane lipoprotein-sorting protein [Arcanobacterium wilhelmae]WFN89802.1 hypothetical protein P8A24_06240 [Arcanobacterium wilhelmae]